MEPDVGEEYDRPDHDTSDAGDEVEPSYTSLSSENPMQAKHTTHRIR